MGEIAKKYPFHREVEIIYYFTAHYIDMATSEEIERKIAFDGQFLDNEKQCYLYAMGIAYDMMEKNEMFDNLEFIAC